MEAIVLAGGLGTRLRSEVSELPKSMAPIHGKPFLEYLLDHLINNGVTRVIFSVGYKADAIEKHFGNKYKSCKIDYAIEKEQLGTGGAIKNAMQYVTAKNVLAMNGDSIVYSDIKKQFEEHLALNADITLALKHLNDFERYGTVETDESGRITAFKEKQAVKEGYINAGVYVFNVDKFNELDLPQKFSVEKDLFEKKLSELKINGFGTKGYFLDIGIPEDFKKAQMELGVFSQINDSWTLFLDRDGVINKKLENDYVRSPNELELLPGAISSIAQLSRIFGRTIVVTNQQGIGKGLMTEVDLADVHSIIESKVEEQEGKIDAIYFAPQLASENSPMRKPNIGMALKAKEDFLKVDFSRSIIIGDSKSDMEFGKNAGMHCVFIGKSKEFYCTSSLKEFNLLLQGLVN